MRRPATAILLFVLVGFWAGCGGGGGSEEPAEPPTSGIAKRAFVSNEFASVLHIVDASNDTDANFPILTGAGPSILALSPGQYVAVYNSTAQTVNIIDIGEEAITQQYSLAGAPEVMAIAGNGGRRVFIPLPGVPAGAGIGVVAVLNLDNQNTSSIPLVRARRAVASPNGSRVLVFSDNSNSVSIIDASNDAVTTVGGFDRPIHAVFDGENRAYVMSCGPECGGTTAQVQVLDLTSNTITGSVAVSAATVGLLDGGTLYVAGTSAAGGRLDVITASSLTVSRSGVAISEGYHHKMVLHQGKLFIAATNPSFGGGSTCLDLAADRSCLTIFEPSSGNAVVPSAVDRFGQNKGPVTGLTAIAGRNVVYAAEGGELRIYDATTNDEQTTQISYTGRIVDVVEVD